MKDMKLHIWMGMIFLLFGGRVLANTNWTDQASPLNFGDWADIVATDFNLDGTVDFVAANPDGSEPYSPRSGLPVWLGVTTSYGGRFNWALSESGYLSGSTPSMPYPDPADVGKAQPHIYRVRCGNPGNMMAEWDITCVSTPGISFVQTISGGNHYTAEKIGTWHDVFHPQPIVWEFQCQGDSGEYKVWSHYYGKMANRAYLDTPYVSDREEISVIFHIEGGGTPDDTDVFQIITHPSEFDVTAHYHGCPPDGARLYNDAPYQHLQMGEYMEDWESRFAIRIDPPQNSTACLEEGQKWHFTSPGGPITDDAYSSVAVGDINKDGANDIIGCGPNGVKVFLQDGPKISPISLIIGPHTYSDWNPGTLTVHLNYNNPRAIKTEYWELVKLNYGPVWSVRGELSGPQPDFNMTIPFEWPGPTCGQFAQPDPNTPMMEIEHGPDIVFGRDDKFTFSTFRMSWTGNMGPETSTAYHTVNVGDVNRDGSLDIIVAKDSGGFDVYYNNFFQDLGSESLWVSGQAPSTNAVMKDFKLQDINKDGCLDIVAVSQSDGIHIWLSWVDGSWSSDVGPECDEGYDSLVLGDFNKDGLVDIAVTCVTNSIVIWYQSAEGTWYQKARASLPKAGQQNVGTGSMSSVKVTNENTKSEEWTVTCIATAPDGGEFQVYGDVSGIQTTTAKVGELYVSDNAEIEFTIYDGPIDFALMDKFTFITGKGPLSYRHYVDIDTSDLDNDGNLDIFAANADDQGIRIWRGNGVYGWISETQVDDKHSWNTVLGSVDINFDGNPDVIAGSGAGSLGGIHVWIGDDFDKFTWSGWIYNPLAVGSYDKVTHGDFNLDGNLDIVAANTEGNTDGIRVWEGDGAGGFTARQGPTHRSDYYSVVVDDFNLDGRPDIAAGHAVSQFDVWLNMGDWEWSASTTSGITDVSFWDLTTGDINRDGAPDIIAAKDYDYQYTGVLVYLNDGFGHFSQDNIISVQPAVFKFWGVEVADIDQDGWLDIIGTHSDGNRGIYTFWAVPIGLHEVTYPIELSFPDPDAWDKYFGVTIADFNLDSRPDYVCGNDGHGFQVGFALGTRYGSCSYYMDDYMMDVVYRDVDSGDLTNDGLTDLAFASLGKGIQVFRSYVNYSQGSVQFGALSHPCSDGDYIGVDIADFTRDGLPDIVGTSEGSGATGMDMWISSRDFSMVSVSHTYPEENGYFLIQHDSSIEIFFNKTVDQATITYENFQLKKGNILIPYSLKIGADNTSVLIDPITIERDEEYMLIVRGGSEGLRDEYGNQFDGNGDGVPEESPTDDFILNFSTIDRTPPTIPTGLSGTSIDHGVILTWTANSEPYLDSDLDGYWVSWSYDHIPQEASDYHEVYYEKEVLGNPPVITIRGLDNKRTVYLSVVSQDESGNYSNYASWIQVTPLGRCPEIWWGGMFDTDLSFDAGGNLTIMAFVVDPQNDIRNVELYFQGNPTGAFLYDDGQHGDFGANDGLYAVTYPLEPNVVPSGQYLIELVATDSEGNKSLMWPYLHNMEDKPGEAFSGYEQQFASAEMQFLLDTSMSFYATSAASPDRPQILVAGYQTFPAANYEFGYDHCITAIVTDPNGYEDVKSVEIFMNGNPIGLYFADDGEHEDFKANDQVLGCLIQLPGKYNPYGANYDPPGPILLEIRAEDYEGNTSDLWPYIVSN